MSSRFYPRWVRGNPQLRIFLPDFPMILVKNPSEASPLNKVTFKVPVRMSEWDVRNYLTKIYKLEVVEVRSQIMRAKMPLSPDGTKVIKEGDDYRLCHVQLPAGVEFKHPGEDLFISDGSTDVTAAQKKMTAEQKKADNETIKRHGHRGINVPTWFM